MTSWNKARIPRQRNFLYSTSSFHNFFDRNFALTISYLFRHGKPHLGVSFLNPRWIEFQVRWKSQKRRTIFLKCETTKRGFESARKKFKRLERPQNGPLHSFWFKIWSMRQGLLTTSLLAFHYHSDAERRDLFIKSVFNWQIVFMLRRAQKKQKSTDKLR